MRTQRQAQLLRSTLNLLLGILVCTGSTTLHARLAVDPTWETCGEATRNLMFLDLYSVQVFMPNCAIVEAGLPESLDNSPIHFVVDVHWDRGRPDDLPDLWEAQLMPVCNAAQEQALLTAYHRAGKGDVVDIVYTPGKGTQIALNDELLVEDASYALLHAFYELWYSKSPIAEELAP